MPEIKKQTPRKKKTVKKHSVSGANSTRRTEYASAWPDDDDGISINLYGRSKTGKTTLWATFPGPILAIICSGGKRPGEMRSIDTPEYRKKINPVILRRTDQLPEFLEMSNDYQTVVIDHVSSLQDHTLKEVLGLEELPAQKSWGMATQQQYGTCSLRMKEMLRSVLDLSCYRVIVAQERDFNTDTEGDLLMPFVASALTPSVVGWLNPAVDYICQTFIRGKTEEKKIKIGKRTTLQRNRIPGVEYCLRVGPHDVFTTGFRVTKGTELPEFIVDPTFDKINALIQGG